VIVVTFNEVDAERAREGGANDALPGTSDPHDNVEGAGTLRQWIYSALATSHGSSAIHS
jgi:hypothetical protein